MIYGLHPLDFSIVIGSLIGVLIVGWLVSRRAHKASDFLVGGRKLGWLLQFFLNFGNMADSNGAPTVSAEVYRQGVGGAWINFQLLFTTPFYWFFPVWFRRSRQVTFADLFIDRFNDRRLATSICHYQHVGHFGHHHHGQRHFLQSGLRHAFETRCGMEHAGTAISRCFPRV